MRHDLGDVVVRARGLGLHLLPRRSLEDLAGSSGTASLARALQKAGYGTASREDEAPVSAAEALDEAIDREIQRRLDLLGRWLGPRRAALFAGVFEDERRRALRTLLRRLVARDRRDAKVGTRGAAALSPRLARALAGARDPADFARVLTRDHSPYAAPLSEAIRNRGPDLRAAESAIDRTFARRGRQAAELLGGRLMEWVADGIDLENAWDALLQGGSEFLEGGARLSREQHAAAAGEADEAARRRNLAAALGPDRLGVAFADPQISFASLEARALAARVRLERRAVRIEPLGAGPVLLTVLRLRAERGDLRRINAGVAQGLPSDVIVAALAGEA